MAGFLDFLNKPGAMDFLSKPGAFNFSGPGLLDGGPPPADTPLPVQQQTSVPVAQPMPDTSGLNTAGPPPVQQPGFLDRLMVRAGTPDERGLNWGDKLYAAGAIARGQDAGDFLRQREGVAQQQRQLATAQQSMAALRDAIGPDGQLDIQKYLKGLPAGADPLEGIKARNELRTKYDVMSGQHGKLTAVDPYNPSAPVTVDKGDPEQPQMFMPDANGRMQLNPLYMQGVQAKAAAERAGKPLAPRAGRAGPKPKSYGASEVNWGG